MYAFMVNFRRTWFTARDDCKNKGGTLVVILNESQQHFLQKMMSSINVHMDVWIGLSAQPKSDYIWVSGKCFFLRKLSMLANEPRHEKACLQSLRPGKTQTQPAQLMGLAKILKF